MYFPQFLYGMLAVSVIMAIWTYLGTGSFLQSLSWTLLTLIVLQVGYFVLALGLLYKPTGRTEAKPKPVNNSAKPVTRDDGIRSQGGR